MRAPTAPFTVQHKIFWEPDNSDNKFYFHVREQKTVVFSNLTFLFSFLPVILVISLPE